jgi:hypothetical protein
MLPRAYCLSLFWARCIPPTPFHPYFRKIYSNSMYPSTPKFSEWPLSFRLFEPQLCMHFLFLPCVLQAQIHVQNLIHFPSPKSLQRILLSPCVTFCNRLSLTVRSYKHLTQPTSCRTSLCRLFATAYLIFPVTFHIWRLSSILNPRTSHTVVTGTLMT